MYRCCWRITYGLANRLESTALLTSRTRTKATPGIDQLRAAHAMIGRTGGENSVACHGQTKGMRGLFFLSLWGVDRNSLKTGKKILLEQRKRTLLPVLLQAAIDKPGYFCS